MKFVEVKELPGRTIKKDLVAYVEEFMSMNVKIAKVDFNDREYRSARSAYSSFHKTSHRLGYPISIRMISNELFLVRNDM